MNLDSELRNGFLSAEGLIELQDAENYGTAPPMQWLEKRLIILKKLVQENHMVFLFDGVISQKITSLDQFYLWCEKVLPIAYACFFKNQRFE